jgi:DNA-binding beta-propeller fold protein YncE
MLERRFSGLLGWACFCFVCVLLLSVAGAYAAPQGSTYKVIRRIPVGGEGGWDYLRVDPDAHRLYVSRGTHMMVIDEVSGKVIGDITNTKGVHGIALATDLGRGFTSNGQANTVTIVDLKTLKPISEVKLTGENPDSIIYDPGTKRVFTFNGRTANATALDANSGQVVGTVALGGKPEEPALDGKGNVFVNIEDKNEMVVFDAKTLAIKNRWPLAPCEGPSALAMDTAHRRLFVACEKVMVVVNADTGKIVASPPIGNGADGNGFDPATGLLFASCGEGIVSILHQDSADKYSVVGNVKTQFGARTMDVDRKTHHVFTVTADFKAAAAPTPDNPRPRPQPIAGSFVILELAQ